MFSEVRNGGGSEATGRVMLWCGGGRPRRCVWWAAADGGTGSGEEGGKEGRGISITLLKGGIKGGDAFKESSNKTHSSLTRT